METRVSSDGLITFPLIGEVEVTGKSPLKIEQLISKELSKGGFMGCASNCNGFGEQKSASVCFRSS